MKALKILLDERNHHLDIFKQNKELGNPNEYSYIVTLNEAIKELESLQAEYKNLNEYYWFARNHIESYRCDCGALGRVGYPCSNKECSEV